MGYREWLLYGKAQSRTKQEPVDLPENSSFLFLGDWEKERFYGNNHVVVVPVRSFPLFPWKRVFNIL
jgi:hypothetical protein